MLGTPPNLYSFVLPLRSRHLDKPPAIVILHPTPPSIGSWQKLAYFRDVWYVPGSGLEADDLRRAGVVAEPASMDDPPL